MVVSVEEVSASIVREYLSRKGLKRTIACMDEEHPRTHSSINNRSQLRQILHIEDLYRRNKVESSPLRTLLEIVIKHHIEGADDDKMASKERESLESALIVASIEHDRVKLRSHVKEASPRLNQHDTGVHQGPSEGEKKPPEMVPKSRRMRRGVMAGPISSTLQDPNKPRLSGRQSGDGMSLLSLQQKGCEKSTSDTAERPQGSQNVGQGGHDRNIVRPKRTPPPNVDLSEMVLDDIEDELLELSNVSIRNLVTASGRHTSRPMDQHTASELKAVLLGSPVKCFSVEWTNQAFTFSETHDLRYGIVQKKGGPCGVLASIQAFVLKKLLFENPDSGQARLQALRPTNAARRQSLTLAVAEVLWRAGQDTRATLAINTGRNVFTPSGHFRSEGVLEKITCLTVDSMKDLQLLVEQHIEQFETGELGCLLLTVSAVLSRSTDKVREDMDVATNSLIGAHGYCTQELVNLLLVGRAVSNVFDGDVELDTGDGDSTLLKGIQGHCNVGLLSLFEHYNIFKVGDHLKNPLFPIWVVCSESHFSVLFGLQGELLTNQDEGPDLDLYYYDGLANQQEEIRLTVSVGKSPLSGQHADPDLIPPLELCIRTRRMVRSCCCRRQEGLPWRIECLGSGV
ncbi:probable ubiquitin carboxyl-terminal hydrolase MINDY-4 isoform X1 [Nerophis lumbriciformis]|uniref:probable ubiquitin carboxyl-terminal hydrolase MINDY-4 isoform X1 n=1 Tax=Nerophis lumbriciformis TaxID=546530 RepID=UPI003BADB5D0